MPTNYSDIIMYLDAIAAKATGLFSNSPHGYWWHINQDNTQGPLAYGDFVTGTVYNVTDAGGNPIPIIGTDSNQTDPSQSLFYLLLSTRGGYTLNNDAGSQYFPQMPGGGPYITDPNYSVKLKDGSSITGADIGNNIADWLGNKYPEK